MIYLTKEELVTAYNEADKAAQDWFKPFDEYERIAANKISKTLGKDMPRVNDGSLAASLIETPMQVYPLMQPGKFKATNHKEAWFNELINLIWKKKIVPNANTQATYFDKEQISLYRATKYGAQPRYNFFVSTDKYTGSDWSLPYIRNVKLEPGKFSADDCDYIFLDIYFTKLQLKNLAEQVKIAKDTTWNVKNIKTLAECATTDKEAEEQNINERERVNSSGIKVTACFNRGVDAPFYMFSKHLPEGELLREWKNPDPTGDLPITMQYCYENLESPYGIGRIELAGPTQNVLDYMTQAHVLATQVGIQPPVQIKGQVETSNLNSMTYTPRAKWIMGGASAELMNSTNAVYTQFPNNFGLYKSQLQTLQGRTDGSVSATSGNPDFSKTSAGVNQQVARTNAQDNYLRNKADTASAKMAEKMMNIYIANMQGADLLEIAEDEKQQLEAAGYFNDNPMDDIPSINEIPIMFEDLRDTFKFEFDPRPEADIDEKNRWVELLDITASNPNILPMIQQSGYNLDLGEMYKKIVQASGAEGWDKVITKIEPEMAAGQGQEMGQEMQPDVSQMGLEETMQMYGIDETDAAAVMDARQQGFNEQDIVEFLSQQGGTQ